MYGEKVDFHSNVSYCFKSDQEGYVFVCNDTSHEEVAFGYLVNDSQKYFRLAYAIGFSFE